MKNKYENIIDFMHSECKLTKNGQTREECCLEKQINDCPEEYVIKKSGHTSEIITVTFFVLIIAFIYYGVRKKWFTSAWRKRSEFTKAIVSGWLVWVVIIISFVLVIEPYGSRMYDEDLINVLLWLSLPPMAVLLTYLWVKRFIWRK